MALEDSQFCQAANESIDYLLTNSTWVTIYPSQFVDFDFAFEMDFTSITSGTLKYVNDNIYITLDFSNGTGSIN